MNYLFNLFSLALLITITVISIPSVYGDGLTSETLPPVLVGNTNVTLMVSGFGPSFDLPHAQRGVTLQILDPNGNLVPDITYAVTIFKEGKSLFGHIFKEDDGRIYITFVQTDKNETSFVEEKPSIFTPSVEGNYVDIYGPDFTSGLYKFHILILSAYSYSQLSKSVEYEVNISIPDYHTYPIYDSNSENQTVTILGFYNKLEDFRYDRDSKAMSFTMPFSWTKNNIDQLNVVHQEIRIPNTFSDYMVTKYDAYVNGIKLPDKAIAIDDYSFEGERIIHIILYKFVVEDLVEKISDKKDAMSFLFLPSNETAFPITHYAKNGQYIVSMKWAPPQITPGSNTTFSFLIQSPYSVNKTMVSTGYNFIVDVNHDKIFKKSGISDAYNNTVTVPFPKNARGPVVISLENMGGNNRAEADFNSVISNPTIIPEFPSNSYIVLIFIFVTMILMRRLMTASR